MTACIWLAARSNTVADERRGLPPIVIGCLRPAELDPCEDCPQCSLDDEVPA